MPQNPNDLQLEAIYQLQSSVVEVDRTLQSMGFTQDNMMFWLGIITALAFVAGIFTVKNSRG